MRRASPDRTPHARSPRPHSACALPPRAADNKIGDDGMRALADALAGGTAPSLERINLSGSPGNADPVKQAAPAGCTVFG